VMDCTSRSMGCVVSAGLPTAHTDALWWEHSLLNVVHDSVSYSLWNKGMDRALDPERKVPVVL